MALFVEESDGARGVARGVENLNLTAAQVDDVAVGKEVGFDVALAGVIRLLID